MSEENTPATWPRCSEASSAITTGLAGLQPGPFASAADSRLAGLQPGSSIPAGLQPGSSVLATLQPGPSIPATLERGEPSGEPTVGLAGFQPSPFASAADSRLAGLQPGSSIPA